MSIDSIIVLAAIILAFAMLAAVLAWDDYCARLAHRIRDRDRKEVAPTAAAASQARRPQPDKQLQQTAH